MQTNDQGLRWLSAGLFIAALVAALITAFGRLPTLPPAEVSRPPLATPSALSSQFSSGFLPKTGDSAATASLAQLPDGRLLAAWVASTQEGGESSAIWFSRLGPSGWSPAQIIANRESTASGSFAHVRDVAYPQLYAEGSWLHLWYISTSIAGLGGRAIQHSVSTDAGLSWLKPNQLAISPSGIGHTALRSAPMPLTDDGLALPIFYGSASQASAWLRLSASGEVIEKIRPLSTIESAPANVPFAQLRLRSGRLLRAGNPPGERNTLQLWISSNEGKTWASSKPIESAPDGGAEFSDPALLLGRNGLIHLAYTWRGQRIKHVAFSEAWLDATAP
jgi:hypothetical protein